MLHRLTIQNFAIIDQLTLEFSAGFGVISGETGAGKSILIDAIGLLLGDRAETGLVADGAQRADITAEFVLDKQHPARRWLVDQALEPDEDDPLLIRRMLPANGGSRSWINGQAVTAGQLQSLGGFLVEIHGQHAHQKLTQATEQLNWLDRQVPSTIRTHVQQTAEEHRRLDDQLEALYEQTLSASEQELLEFQLGELDQFAPQAGEYAQLETDQRKLASVDALQLALDQSLQALDADESGAQHLTHRAQAELEPLQRNAEELTEIVQMLEEAKVNLAEASSAIERAAGQLETDPKRLNEIDQRLGRYIELARKHRIEPAELAGFQQGIAERLDQMKQSSQQRESLEQALENARKQWLRHAKKLHNARQKAARVLEQSTADALAELGMTDARIEFEIELDTTAMVSPSGADRVAIGFSANPGQSLKPLRKVASGGELSRLSLAMIIASADPSSTITRIFDEIDAGVGGETAHRVGDYLHRSGQQGQSLCVTHLAQVAARADFQLKVSKQANKHKTLVEIHALNDDQRIQELARMLGSESSDISRQHAKTLLQGKQVKI